MKRQSKRDLALQLDRIERQENRNWELQDRAIRELYERVSKLEHQIKYGNEKLSMRTEILEDAYTLIARTLDANNIKEACMHCGQKLPKEKNCC